MLYYLKQATTPCINKVMLSLIYQTYLILMDSFSLERWNKSKDLVYNPNYNVYEVKHIQMAKPKIIARTKIEVKL